MLHRLFLPVLIILLNAGCTDGFSATQIALPPASSPGRTQTPQAVIVQTSATIPVVSQTIACDDWQSWPVVPVLRPPARELYERGQASGNDARAFSKIGDGEIAAAWFLTVFDLGPEHYDLGSYQDLKPLIEHFAGSFERIGMAAKRGFNTQEILDPDSDRSMLCQSGESPLTCELRLHRPAFAILSLGTNQVWKPDEFEAGMRQILDILLEHSVLPILSTKGDNLEGDHRINHITACLAQEYDIPLWNFWAAIQPLPHHGLQPDLEHLTYGVPDFDDENSMQSAWTVRNLTALQVLDAVRREVTTQK